MLEELMSDLMVTVPTALLALAALAAAISGLLAAYQEWRERCKERELAEVRERRAFRLRQEARAGSVDARARMAAFRFRPLTDAERARFLAAWRRARLHFAEDPALAVLEADALVDELAYARGFPAWTLEFDEATPLAWRYPELEGHYRTAHRIAAEVHRARTSPDVLRDALHSYNVICDRLLRTAS